MDELDITFESLPGDAQLTPSDDSKAVEPVADAMTLAELNAYTGKNFPSKEAALKSIKDTISYVGKKTEDIRKEVQAEVSNDNKTDSLAKELAEMRVERFFDKNPDLVAYRSAYEKVGGNPESFFNAPEIKPIIEKAQGYDKSQTLKTVLESNPRIASSKDNLSKAREALQSGNKIQSEELAVKAVLESMGL